VISISNTRYLIILNENKHYNQELKNNCEVSDTMSLKQKIIIISVIFIFIIGTFTMYFLMVFIKLCGIMNMF